MIVRYEFLNQKQLIILQKLIKTKTVEKHEIIPFALPSNSEFKIILKSAKNQFLNAKVSIITKNKDTFSRAKSIIDFLEKVCETYFETEVKKKFKKHILVFCLFWKRYFDNENIK